MTRHSASAPHDLSQTVEHKALFGRAVESVKWAGLAILVPRLFTPLSTFVLAALLAPADFGIVAIATLVVQLVQNVAGLGLEAAVVQRRSSLAEAASSAFWLSLLASCVGYAALWALAPWLAGVYQMPAVLAAIRVSALSLPLTALGSVSKALLQRELGFRALFLVNATSLVTSALVSMVLAVAGAGLWALVWGPLAGTAASTLIAWWSARWRPTLSVHLPTARSLLGFGAWVMLSFIQSWFFIYGDKALAGLFLDTGDLGVYSLGYNLANLLPGLLSTSLTPVAYPVFCELQGDVAQVGRSLLKLQEMEAALALPLAFGVSVVAAPAVALLYGDKWQGLGMVIGYLTLMPGLCHLWSLNAEAYRAIGRPDVWAKLAGASLIVQMLLLALAGRQGLRAFTLARFGGGFLLPALSLFVGARILQTPIRDQVRVLVAPSACAALMFVAVWALLRWRAPLIGASGWATLLLSIAAGALLYPALLWATRRDLVERLTSSLRQMLGVAR